MTFPQYRKTSNNKNFYKILSDDQWEEIQLIGKRAFYYNFTATQYPEMLLLKSILDCDGNYEPSSVQEFENFNTRR